MNEWHSLVVLKKKKIITLFFLWSTWFWIRFDFTFLRSLGMFFEFTESKMDIDRILIQLGKTSEQQWLEIQILLVLWTCHLVKACQCKTGTMAWEIPVQWASWTALDMEALVIWDQWTLDQECSPLLIRATVMG